MRATVAGVCLLTLVATFVVCSSAASTAPGNGYSGLRSKQRTIRGFKNVALSTARGFGKRGSLAAEYSGAYNDIADKNIESLPVVEWFVQELRSNPELVRFLLAKYFDSNQDGQLSSDELPRATIY